MRLDVKADQIRSKQPVEQFTLPGANPESFGVWPRDMPENSNPGIGTPGFDQVRKQGKVIVLDQHERPVYSGNLIENGLRELLIDSLVTLPVRSPKYGTRMSNMAERPDSFV